MAIRLVYGGPLIIFRTVQGGVLSRVATLLVFWFSGDVSWCFPKRGVGSRKYRVAPQFFQFFLGVLGLFIFVHGRGSRATYLLRKGERHHGHRVHVVYLVRIRRGLVVRLVGVVSKGSRGVFQVVAFRVTRVLVGNVNYANVPFAIVTSLVQ